MLEHTYLHDRKWSDAYIPAIKRIIGPYLLTESPEVIDQKQASDLIVMTGRNMMIACRIRRPGYFEKYPYEFTIRYHRNSGADTEYKKITKGWGDWMFYGHANGNEKDYNIEHWYLIDLKQFRYHLINNKEMIKKHYGIKYNSDNETCFLWFDVRGFPKNEPLLIASSEDI